MLSAVPSPRQLAWQELEFYGFLHYGVNTFTDREWGDGTESESVFNPERQEASQWVAAAKAAGMRGLILTAKHHDGFCLWPSAYTSHSVRRSPYRGGRGDVVGELSRACASAGLRFGVYLSPWDRNAACYGTDAYNEYYRSQLTELCTKYGELFCVWLDGACGEGPNGRRQQYDFESYYAIVRKYQPKAVISICGPDVRWCGNERGIARDAEWSVVPRGADAQSPDLGSREAVLGKELIWHPAETDVSIRPGWFYHKKEDGSVRSGEELVRLYESTVGANSALLLNVPPDRRGLIAEPDFAALSEMGRVLKQRYETNLMPGASVAVDTAGADVLPLISEDSRSRFWTGADGAPGSITISFPKPISFSRMVLRENIALSQRIEGVTLSATVGGAKVALASAQTVGAKRILAFPQTVSDTLRLTITASRSFPTLSFVGLY